MAKKTYNQQRQQRDGASFGAIFSIAFPVGVGAYVRSALSSIEHIAIPRGLEMSLSPSRALASYGILHGMVFPLLTFPAAILGAFSSLLIPELSSASARQERERISRIVSRVIWLSLLFSLYISGIFISFSTDIGMFLYKSTEAAEYIRLLSPLIPLMYLDNAVDSMLKGLNQHLYCMRVNIVDSALSIILILTLLPSMGIRGYITVVFVTELLNTSLSILRLLSITGTDAKCIKWVFKPLTSIIISTSLTRVIFMLPPFLQISRIWSGGELALKITLCSLFYIIISLLVGAVGRSDIYKAKRFINLSTLRRTFH